MSGQGRVIVGSTGDEVDMKDTVARTMAVRALNAAPPTANSTGTLGEIRWTADYIYVCVATDVWKRASLLIWK